MTDCPICMDAILDSCKDCCTTPCGHMFHSSCIFKSFSNSFSCPMCRNELIESSSVDSESLYSDEESEDEDEETDNEDKPRFTLKQIHEVLKKRGFGEEDLLAIILQNSDIDLVGNSEAIEKKSEDLLDVLYDIYDNAISVDYRDSRTYAQVLLGSKKTEEAGSGPLSENQGFPNLSLMKIELEEENQSENQGFPNLSLMKIELEEENQSENQGFPNLSLMKIELEEEKQINKLKVE